MDFLIDADFSTCDGAVVNASRFNIVRLANVFWTADLDNDGVRSLYCQTINVNTNSVAGVAQPIIDGVDAIQIQYGVAANVEDDPANLIQRYQSYTNLVAGIADPSIRTQNVKAIRIALLVNGGFAGDADSQLEIEQDRNYQMLDASVAIDDDRVLRQVYSTTIAIPNNF